MQQPPEVGERVAKRQILEPAAGLGVLQGLAGGPVQHLARPRDLGRHLAEEHGIDHHREMGPGVAEKLRRAGAAGVGGSDEQPQPACLDRGAPRPAREPRQRQITRGFDDEDPNPGAALEGLDHEAGAGADHGDDRRVAPRHGLRDLRLGFPLGIAGAVQAQRSPVGGHEPDVGVLAFDGERSVAGRLARPRQRAGVNPSERREIVVQGRGHGWRRSERTLRADYVSARLISACGGERQPHSPRRVGTSW